MSCFNSNCYLPQPPRAWSRVQNSCSLTYDSDLVKDPYTGQNVSSIVLAEKIAMLNKGNILQYKCNSSNLTKAQRYSKIAKGQWVNRNTTWATQSTRGGTNPNSTSLKRAGNVINIAIDPITGIIIGPTIAPITCPQPIIPNNPMLPSNISGGGDVINPILPPPIDPTPGSNIFPNIVQDVPISPIVIPDGGTLICSIQENVCTGETKRSLSQQLCHPTTDSNVPGPIRDLCWNDGTQTWYPKTRYVMTNSANKWPVNATLVGAIVINPPFITSISLDQNIVTLTWTFPSLCLRATNFNIYQNGIFIKVVPGVIFTTTIIIDGENTYNYYIVAENITAKSISDNSNIVSINSLCVLLPPINVQSILDQTTLNSVYNVNVSWTPVTQCINNYTYNLYYNGNVITGIPSNVTSYTLTGLIPNTAYIIYMKTVSNGKISDKSNDSFVYVLPLYIETKVTTIYDNDDGYIGLVYTDIFNTGTLIFNYTISDVNFIIIAGGGGGGIPSSNLIPGGGGGGGGYYTTYPTPPTPYLPINSLPNEIITITIGLGGLGAPLNGTNNGTQGGDTILNFPNSNPSEYKAIGGNGSSGANGTVQTGGYAINGTFNTGSNLVGNIGYGGDGGSGNSLAPNFGPGIASNIEPFILPLPFSTSLYISGGGGAALTTGNGGGCGAGIGGSAGISGNGNGISASNTFPSFGGGGGGGYRIDIAGNGGKGACLIWFPSFE